MAGFYLYGANPSELANQQFGYDQFFTRTAEGNRAAAADAERFNIQAFLQAQAADEAARERDSAMRANLFQNEMARRASAEQNAFARSIDARNFAAQQADKQRAERVNAPYLEAQTGLVKAQTKAAETNGNFNLKLGHEMASRAAQQGLILSADDAMKKFGLPKEAAESYFMQSKDVQNAYDAQDAELSSAAKIMTAFSKAKREVDALNATPVASDFWLPGTPNADARKIDLSKPKQVMDALQKRVDYLQSNRRQDILNQLEVDPETGVYTPIIPQRPWRAGKTSGTGTTGGASFFNQPSRTASAGGGDDFSKLEGKIIVQGGNQFIVKSGKVVPL